MITGYVWSKDTGKRHLAAYGGYDTQMGHFIIVWHGDKRCREFNLGRRWKLSKKFEAERLK